MRGQSKWRDGRPVAWLFAVTIVLPSLALAVLAYRALDSDRQLAEQVWRERLQDETRRAFSQLERRVLEIRGRADALARGEELDRGTRDGMIALILAPELKLAPVSAFAWVPDGRLPVTAALPAELEQAESRELRQASPRQAIAMYASLLQRAPAPWRGWIHLRLARVFAQAGEAAESRVALQRASSLPDSPGLAPSRFAARFELASGLPEEAALLYRDLNAGTWLLEKSPYAYYEMRLLEWAGGRIPPEILAGEQRRQVMSRLLERVLHGESGWLREGSVSALATTSSHTRAAAILTPDTQWELWLAETAREAPRDLFIRAGAAPPRNSRLAPALSLSSLGLPWWVWSEPRDPGAPGRENESRRRLLLAALLLVAGVLAFGSFATVRLVRRELRIAQLQSDFTATVSHEFRSPLTGIRQLGEMLLAGRAANDEPRRQQYYELICRESDRLTRLVENVLGFARMEDGRKQYRLERIETGEWLRELAGIAAQRRTVDAEFPPDLPAVEGDKDALSSAVLNLLDNAIKYSPDGAPVSLQASGEGGWVTIVIRDRGRGIAPEEQRRIFDRFYRGPEAGGGPAPGVGFGLALVKRIADAHGARIRVESTPGKGSTFYLSLKAAV